MTSALLLLLLDSRAPAGGHGHSGGMEAAVTAGFVSGAGDVERFCRFRLRTSGQAAAAFAAVACQLWLDGGGDPARWAELDAEFGARVPSEAARAASRQLGSGLRRLVQAMVPDAGLGGPWQRIERPAPHHPVVLGAAVALAGGNPRLAALAAALGTCTAPASAAVRLLGLDPYAVQGVLAALSAEIDATAVAGARFATPAGLADMAEPTKPPTPTELPELSGPASLLRTLADLPALATPALELLADVHARSEVRLFAS